MSISILGVDLLNLIYLALHLVNSSSFPKPLSPKDEKKYIELCRQGDHEARNKLIEHNLRLVAHIIKKYYSSIKEQDDLISIGTIGLIKAVSTFDSGKGTRLATYAARCIENEILMYFRGQKKTAGEVFINDPIDTDNEGNTLSIIDIISDNETIIDDIDLKIKTDRLYEYVKSSLSPREQIIITLRYGLYGEIPLTQREIASRLKISRSYVSRIEKKALTILRKQFEKHV